jgi:hypothetical protein
MILSCYMESFDHRYCVGALWVAIRTCRSVSFSCLLLSWDPWPSNMTLTSLSMCGKAPPPAPFCCGGCSYIVGSLCGGGDGSGRNGRSRLTVFLKSLQLRRVWRISLWYGHWVSRISFSVCTLPRGTSQG